MSFTKMLWVTDEPTFKVSIQTSIRDGGPRSFRVRVGTRIRDGASRKFKVSVSTSIRNG